LEAVCVKKTFLVPAATTLFGWHKWTNKPGFYNCKAAVKMWLGGKLSQVQRDEYEEHYLIARNGARLTIKRAARGLLRTPTAKSCGRERESQLAKDLVRGPKRAEWLAMAAAGCWRLPSSQLCCDIRSIRNTVTISHKRGKRRNQVAWRKILFNSHALRGVKTRGRRGKTLAIFARLKGLLLNLTLYLLGAFDITSPKSRPKGGTRALEVQRLAGPGKQPKPGGASSYSWPGCCFQAKSTSWRSTGDTDGRPAKSIRQNDAGRLPSTVEFSFLR